MLDAFPVLTGATATEPVARLTAGSGLVVAAIDGHCHELELLLSALFLSGGEVGVRVLALACSSRS